MAEGARSEPAKKALATLDREWDGLIAHREYPIISCLGACGRNGGKPLSGSGLERFLPWNAAPADLRAWAQPPPPG